MIGYLVVFASVLAVGVFGIIALGRAYEREAAERAKQAGERQEADRHARIVALFERMILANWGNERSDSDPSDYWMAASVMIDFEDEMRQKVGAK